MELIHCTKELIDVWLTYRIGIKPFTLDDHSCRSEIVIVDVVSIAINATIVVFDRIRENRKIMRTGNFAEIVDTSIWDTMTRSVNTTVTTLIVMVLLLIMGVSSIRNFALPICIGIVCGCYSSVCISGPLWNKFNHGRVKR